MSQLNEFQEKFAALSQREKIIVVATTLIGLWFAWDNLFYQPYQKRRNNLQQEADKLQQQLADQQIELIRLENGSRNDPNLKNRNKLLESKTEYGRLQDLLKHNNKSFAPPQLMAVTLSDILEQNKQLTLIKLDTLAPSTLLPVKQSQETPIYKHGLVITFKGSYLDTYSYLQALEALPWHFIWESIDYRVKDYPIAETTLKTYTLSFKENLLDL